jgi:hypothetical protein
MNNIVHNTRKKNMVYKFVPSFQENISDIDDKKVFFYQITTFENPRHNRYNLREFCLNNNNEILDVKLYWLTKKQYKKFIAQKKSNEYKSYNVYDLTHVKYPTLYDIETSKSELLNYNDNYTGFANF